MRKPRLREANLLKMAQVGTGRLLTYCWPSDSHSSVPPPHQSSPKLPPWPSCLPKLHVISDDAFLVHSTLLFEDVVSVTIPLEITAKTLENVSL